MSARSSWAAIPTPTCVFVGIGHRAEFDNLARPVTDHRELPVPKHLLTKTIEADGVMVVFQHWLDPNGSAS